MKPQILIVNNQKMIAEAFISLMGEAAECSMASIGEARQMVTQVQFSYAIVDIDWVDGGNGLALISPLLLAKVKPIVLASSASVGQIRAAIRLGAYGYVDKSQPSAHLHAVLHDVLEDKFSFPQGMIDELRQNVNLIIPKLSKSEKKLLDYFFVHAEQTNAQIGDGLSLCEGRIRNCMTSLMQKFKVKSRAILIREATLRGYFPGYSHV